MAKKIKKGKKGKRKLAAVAVAPVAVEVIEPVVAALPKPKATNGKAVKSRLNPEVTERMKAQLIREARTVKDLTDRTEAARKRRNNTIRALCDRGLSERELGEMTGMSGPRINQIYHGTNGSRS